MNNQDLINRIQELENWKNQMESSHSIPLNIDQAFRARFATTGSTLSTSGKGATSQNQSVDEGGIAVYSVLGPPVGFLQVTVGNTVYYLPYYNA